MTKYYINGKKVTQEVKKMELYKHETDGGAVYYCTTFVICPNGEKEGTLEGAIMRTDGGELEIFTKKLEALNIKLVIR